MKSVANLNNFDQVDPAVLKVINILNKYICFGLCGSKKKAFTKYLKVLIQFFDSTYKIFLLKPK